MIGASTVDRPLDIGEIFDRTVTVFVRNWILVVMLMLPSSIPDAVALAANHGRPLPRPAMLLDAVAVTFIFAWTSVAMVRVFADPAAPRTAGALLRMTAREYRRSLGAFWLAYATFFAAFLALTVLVGAVVGVAYAVAHIGGIVVAAVALGIPAAVATVWATMVIAVAYPVTIVERCSPWRGLKRGIALVRAGGIRRALLLGLAALAIWLIPAAIAVTIASAAVRNTSLWWLPVVEPLVIGTTLTGFGSGLATVIAMDYRNRRDGADLHAALA